MRDGNISRDAARKLRYRAMSDPLHARVESTRTVSWDVAGRCECPAGVTLQGRRDPLGRPGLTAHLEVRCRKCAACQAERRAAWRARMRVELNVSPRTWFVTLTMRPDEHHRFQVLARRKIAAGAIVRSDVVEHERLWPVWAQLELEAVTRYLKRVRKGGHFRHECGQALEQASTRMRYVLVVERHKSGAPHFHLLVHEMAGYPGFSRRWLSSQWPHGFGVWKIADIRTAGYVAKYVGKEIACRVRASRRYGDSALWAEVAAAEGSTRKEATVNKTSHLLAQEQPPQPSEEVS